MAWAILVGRAKAEVSVVEPAIRLTVAGEELGATRLHLPILVRPVKYTLPARLRGLEPHGVDAVRPGDIANPFSQFRP